MSHQHNMIPSAFVPFNQGYPIRFEAIGLLWALVLAMQPRAPSSIGSGSGSRPALGGAKDGAATGPAQVLLAEVAHRVAKSNLIASERLRLWKLRDGALQVR